EMTLWLEAERMAAPFRATDSTRLAAARGAIKNERQELENSPFSSSNPVTAEVLYGSVHPYRSPIGPMDDLNGASFSAMRDFCTPYYVPNNAVLVVSGDFKTAEARTMVQKYFGGIPRGTPAVHPEMRPAIAG